MNAMKISLIDCELLPLTLRLIFVLQLQIAIYFFEHAFSFLSIFALSFN